jgi:hypothetical protein
MFFPLGWVVGKILVKSPQAWVPGPLFFILTLCLYAFLKGPVPLVFFWMVLSVSVKVTFGTIWREDVHHGILDVVGQNPWAFWALGIWKMIWLTAILGGCAVGVMTALGKVSLGGVAFLYTGAQLLLQAQAELLLLRLTRGQFLGLLVVWPFEIPLLITVLSTLPVGDTLLMVAGFMGLQATLLMAHIHLFCSKKLAFE